MRSLAPIAPGHAVITAAHHLPNRYVIHCLGPVYGVDEPSDRPLADCYRNALHLAQEAAARVAVAAVLDAIPRLAAMNRIRFVLYDAASLRIHAKLVER